jgi:hypothetical protein
MKIPGRILGLLVATLAAPVIAGCAGEVDDPDTAKAESNLQSQKTSASEPAAEPASAAPSQQQESTPPAEKAAEPKSEEPTPEDPCPPCGMG